MLHPPPRPAEGRHSWVGGTAGSHGSLPPLLELLAGPRTLPGGHQCLQILELCLNGLGSLTAVPGGAVSRGFPRKPGAGTTPAPVWSPAPRRPRLSCALGAAAFSPDVLNVSCSSCPSLLGLRRGAPGITGQEERCSVGTVPQELRPGWGHHTAGCHHGLWQVQAGLGLPTGLLSLKLLLELLFKREFPGSLFTAAIYL